MVRHLSLVAIPFLTGLLSFSATVNATPPMTAVIQFGAPMPRAHDANDHAGDNLVPRTIVISAGGTVSFMINGRVHQVAIYKPGIGPDDIDDSGRTGFDGCPGGESGERYIDDPDGLVAIWDPPCADGPNPIMYTFEEPGRYFVVCTFDSHFEIGMWGWVIVK